MARFVLNAVFHQLASAANRFQKCLQGVHNTDVSTHPEDISDAPYR